MAVNLPLSLCFPPGIMLLAIYGIFTFIYRFFFHPLAVFPGPKLTATTFAYERYYDLVLRGQYTFKLQELHRKYGPVIRINLDELHFNDPDYFDEVFNVKNGRADKPYKTANAFGPYPASIGTREHNLHRLRRGAVNVFFSKRSVSDLVPYIHPIIDKLCNRFEDASQTSEPINLKYAYSALTLDIMNEYCFSTDSQYVLKPDFGRKTFDVIDSFLFISLINLHIPWLMRFPYSLPDGLMRVINPAMSDILDMREESANQIEDIRQEKDLSYLESGHRTILHDLLQSRIPAAEKSQSRLRDEAFSLVTAGSGTTAMAVKCISYFVAANPEVQQKLLFELKGVMPKRTDHAKLQDLENLSYLDAVIREGLRVGHTISHRISRMFPDKPLQYHDWVVPAGTIVNMTPLLIHECWNAGTSREQE